MDLQLPDLSRIQALISIRKELPSARIIVLTTFEGNALAYRALKAGAAGYLLKSGIRKELTDAIRIVHTGEKHVPAEIATNLAVQMHYEDLTVREIEVLRAAASGRSNKMIASELFISEETVKVHMKNIMYKLNASDRTRAFSLATAQGFFYKPRRCEPGERPKGQFAPKSPAECHVARPRFREDRKAA